MTKTKNEDNEEPILSQNDSEKSTHQESSMNQETTAAPQSEVSEAEEAVIEKLKAENQELKDRLLRTIADFDNFRRRSRQQQAEQLHYANEKLIRDLLPIIDNFERALEAQEDNGDINSWKAGVQLIARQLTEILERYGVRLVEAVNTTFDPGKHDAVGRVTTEEAPEGCVVEEVQKGYLLHDRVLRPARVRVAAMPHDAETTAETHSETAQGHGDT